MNVAKQLINVSISILNAFPDKDTLDRMVVEAISLGRRELLAIAKHSKPEDLTKMFCAFPSTIFALTDHLTLNV